MSAPACIAVIVASGSSRRMGTDKLLWPLAGEPVLRRTIRAFMAARHISSIVVVCPPDRWQAIFPLPTGKPISRVDGGLERQDSVMRGLACLPPGTEWVAIHDGARPLISPEDIDHCVEIARVHGAAALARPAVDTMKRSDSRGFCQESVSRENLWCMETPQVFLRSLLDAAFTAAARDGEHVTDEVSAVQLLNAPVRFVEAHAPNPKITVPADLPLAEALVSRATDATHGSPL